MERWPPGRYDANTAGHSKGRLGGPGGGADERASANHRDRHTAKTVFVGGLLVDYDQKGAEPAAR